MKKFVKVLWIIAGAALIVSGCFAFVSPQKAMVAFEIICGVALLVSGISSIVAYAATKKIMLGAGWVLADGILSAALGSIIVLSQISGGIIADQYVTTAVFSVFIAILIAMWLLFFGVNSLMRSFELHRFGARGWGFSTFWGIICIICAVSVFCRPVVSGMSAISFLLGSALIVGGIGMLLRCFSRDIED